MLTDFATERMPLHASGLPDFMRCNLMGVLKLLDDRDVGSAADTGSAIHKAASVWHGNGHDLANAVQSMAKGKEKYPLADLQLAAEEFFRYSKDARNSSAKVVLNETQMSLTLPPHPADKTGQDVLILGTLDQVREENGELICCDIKTGKRLSGYEMVTEHALQLMAYQFGASKLLNRPVRSCRIIRTKGYAESKPVFWECPWEWRDLEAFLTGVRHRVAMVRNGELYASPGNYCNYCVGVSTCLERRNEL